MNLKDLEKKLARVLDDVGNPGQMERVAKQGAKEIVKRTKQGGSVKRNLGKVEKLAPLSVGYKKQRRRLRGQGKLSSDTTPEKSNLTRQGDLLNSVDGRGSRNRAEIFIKGSENNRKARQQADKGREFLNLSKKEAKKAVNIIEEDIKNDIKKNGL